MAFANQPSGTLLTEWNFSSTAFPDRWGYDWAPPILSNGGTGSYSPPTYARQTFFVGMTAGISPNNFYYFTEDQGSIRDLYASWFWRPASASGGWEGGNKIHFFSPNPQNFFVVAQLYAVNYWGPWEYAIYFPDLVGGTDNSHLPNGGAVGSMNLRPNIYNKPVVFNVFHEIEVRARYSTTSSSQDGVLSLWVDGDLVVHHTTVNFPGGSAGSYFSEFWFSPTWGNSGEVRTTEGHFDYDHVRIVVPSGGVPPIPSPPPLTVSTDNPRYFDDGTGPKYLAGWYDNFSPQTGGNWTLVLNTISAYGLNLCRLWVRHHVEQTPESYAQSGGLYDLDTPNPTYLAALRSACEDLAARDCYAIVMLWQGWSLIDNGYGNPYPTGPFNLNSNGVNGDWYNSDGYGTEVDEVRDAGNANEIAIRAKQRIWIRAVIDELNDLDNILWEVSNEDRFNTYNQAWQEWVANEIRTYEATLAKQHPVGMSSTYDGTTSVNPWLKGSTADWIAPNDAAGGYASAPEVNTGGKVLISDIDHLQLGYGGANPNVSADWVWKTALRGHQPLQIYPRVEDANMLASLAKSLVYMNALTLANVTPTSDTGQCSTGYLQRWAGREYLAYQPLSDSFSINMLEGHYNFEWFNVVGGTVYSVGVYNNIVGGNTAFTNLVGNSAVLLLNRINNQVAYLGSFFRWIYAHSQGDLPTEYRLKYGSNPGSYSSSVAVSYGTNLIALSQVLPSVGTYFVKIYAYNPTSGEFASGTEVMVEALSGGPVGNIYVTIV